MINTFDDNNWENIKKEEISVIQFSASWCSPCKELTPILEKLSQNSMLNTKKYSPIKTIMIMNQKMN